ncbi:MarR family winged helix-turn-helix transcriptional regulator [Marvinbryantia sp.]
MKVKLAYYISELRRDFVKECSRKLQEDDLTPGLLYPVLYIGRHPGCSPKELTEALHMDWGLTQRTLDRLVASHLISREKNPLDRRRFSLNLTK